MALGYASLGKRVLDRQVEVEQSQGVGYGRASLADSSGDVVLRQGEFVGQLPVGMSFLYCVEVCPLDVLDDGDGKLVALGQLPDDRRDVVQSGHLGGANSSLAGHELVAVQYFGHRSEEHTSELQSRQYLVCR